MSSGWEPVDAVIPSEGRTALEELESEDQIARLLPAREWDAEEQTVRVVEREQAIEGGTMPRRFSAIFRKGSRHLVVDVEVIDSGDEGPRAEVVGTSMSSDRGLTASDPQQVPWGAIFDEAVAIGVARLAFDEEGRPANPEWAQSWNVGAANEATVTAIARRLRRRRGRSLSPEHLADVLKVARANPNRPAMAVAETWGENRTTAAYWIKRANETEGQR
jgi:hypothetical protein